MGAYDFLQRLNLDIIGVWSEKRKEKIPEEIYSWKGDYIFSFQSYFIVPKEILERKESLEKKEREKNVIAQVWNSLDFDLKEVFLNIK